MTDGPRELLNERPDLEPALRAVLEADADAGPDAWTFDDAAVDSGAFGELVSRGVVEKTDDGDYRLADPGAVRAALDGEGADTGGTGDAGGGGGTGAGSGGTVRDDRPSLSLARVPSLARPPSSLRVEVERRVAVALAGALAFLVSFRLFPFPKVFRNGDVVLSGNDPYYYRYWVERLAAEAVGPLDFSAFTVLPGTVTKGEPLMVATLWWVTSLLGGGATTAGQVLAWYPVASALVTGLLVYLLAVELTDDERVGIAAVLLLAVIPAHAMRTGLGFADHHAFDYPWLALTALALVVLARATPGDRDGVTDRAGLAHRRVVLGTVGLAAGTAGQTLAWEAAPLLLVPVAAVVALGALVAVDRGDSPALALGPVAVGLGVAAAVTGAVHLGAGWHTDQVAFAPALLFVGTAGVLVAAEAFHRFDLPVEALAGAEAAGLVGGTLGMALLLPAYWARLTREVGLLLGQRNIVEVQPLFSAGTFGWFFLFGLVLALAVPYLAWGTWRAYHGDRAWLVAAAYGWWTLFLAALQLRFAGELSPFAAVFAGLGLVHVAERVDLARRPVPFAEDDSGRPRTEDGPSAKPAFAWPDRQAATSLVVLFLLVGSIGMIQTPIKHGQLAIDDDTYRTATWMEDHAAAQDLGYPENYVLSKWWRNRVYNYFVSGQSRSYSYAQSTYETFLASTTPEPWYGRFADRVGYVVVEFGGNDPGTMRSRLYDAYGSRREGVPGTGHYRAVYARGGYKVFAVVPGANVTGTGPANATVPVTTEVSIDGAEFTYTRQAETGPDGRFRVTVAYPGEYTVGDRTTTVSERAVRNGGSVET